MERASVPLLILSGVSLGFAAANAHVTPVWLTALSAGAGVVGVAVLIARTTVYRG